MRRIAALVLALFAAAYAGAQTSVSIHDIMVAGTNPVVGTATTRTLPYSPYYGVNVSVSGIVVGVESTGDYAGTVYISEPSSSWDNLVLTAEGMPVFNVAALNSACAVVGNTVTVVGPVVLSTAIVPADVTAAATPGTGVNPTSCTVTSTGGTMTQSIGLGTTLNSFGGALEYTGMTTTATFYAVSPSGGATSTSTGAVTSNGQFWATLSSNTGTNNHLFRSAGIAGDEYVPAGSTAPTWAGNPQRILIDTTTFGGSPVNITVGQTISCVTGSGIKVGATAGIGLIDYTLGYARLLIFPTSVCTVGGTVASTTSAVADSTHFKVGTLDLNSFSSANPAFATRLAKAATAVVSNLGSPDILSVQQVSDYATLTSLANAVNTLGSTTYVPYLSGTTALNTGFLVKSSTLTTDSVGLAPGAAAATYTTAAGASAALWDEVPLVLKAEFVRVGKNYPVTVIDALLTPRDNSGDPTLGANIRARRAAQASAISQLVQAYQTAGQNVVVAGDLNAFEFSDGYVDVTGIIDGSPATAVSTYQATSTTAALTDFNTQVSATSRYNYIERGDAVTYEHVLASATIPDPNTAAASLASYVSSVTQPHFTTDFYASNANSATTSAGLTPHDGFVVSFLIPPVPTTASISPTAINFGSLDLGASGSQTATVTNTTTFVSTVTVTNIAISGTNAGDFSQTSNCTSLTQNATCTVTITFAPTAIGSRSAVLTVTNDSTSDPTLTVTLNGTGLDTTATLSPTTATFPATDIGATSAAQTFVVTNTSTVAISVARLTLTGDFAQTATTCSLTSTLGAGASCTVSVDFVPTAAGTRTGTLVVTNSSTGNPTLTATLTGTGLDTTATLTPASADFGSIYAGGGLSAAKTFTVTNTSAIAIAIKTVSVAGNFTETTTCGTSLAAGGTCTVAVLFAPLSAGALTGTLTVTDGSTANPVLTATLTGTGLPTTATLSPMPATYLNTIVGNTSAGQGFVWTNTSAIPLTISKVSTTGNFTVSANTCTGAVAAGGFCVVTVTFTPLALGPLTGSVTVASTASANPTLTATLSGRGVADVEASVSALDFGNMDIGYTSPTQTFTITNYTAAAISLTGITITGDYAYTSTCPGTLAGLSTCTVTASFTPTALGTRTGAITVNTNDTKYPVITVALTGNGVDFSISANPTSGSTLAGYNETVNLTLTPLGGFAAPIAIGCTTTASGSTCTPQTTPYTLSATTVLPMAITTTSQYTVIGYSGLGGRGWLWLGALLTGLGVLISLRTSARLPRLAALLALLAVLTTANLGCGSQDPSRNANPTLPGTYTYTISATDGKITHTATYSLTIAIRY